jgi:ribosome maturation factor RimP
VPARGERAGRGERDRPGGEGRGAAVAPRPATLGAGGGPAAIERTVTGLGYEVVDIERAARGLLRVTIDRVPGHAYPGAPSDFVTVEDCELVTRQLQYVLEVEGVDYARLEVSSPGLDRPLRRAADYERFAGAQVDLALKAPFEGRRHFRGTLVVRDGGWRLMLDGGEQALDFALDEVREARLVPVVDFKGRRAPAGAPSAPAADEVDGGRRE